MKLRVRGNSVRLRLTQSEVSQLVAEGRVENATRIGTGELRYAVTTTRDVDEVNADLRDNQITISIPAAVIADWTGSEEVGIEYGQVSADGELHVLIEKDFACLKPRSGADDDDTFPNPLAVGKE